MKNYASKIMRRVNAQLPGTKPKASQYDYVVVGAGSAGCALASKLAKAGQHVLLLEAGPPAYDPWLYVPVGYFYTVPKYDWGFYVAPETSGLNGRGIKWPRGKVLGGSSAINGLLYCRGQEKDYDEWKMPGWGMKDVLGNFQNLENHHTRGGAGPIEVSPSRNRNFVVAQKFIEGVSKSIDCPVVADIGGDFSNGPGIGYFQQNTGHATSLRQSSARFLAELPDDAPIEVICSAQVERLDIAGTGEDKAVTGVTLANGAKITAKKEVILSAGALNSPHLMMVSGLGPKAELEKFQIPVHADLDGVGKNLQDHLQCRPKYRVDVPTLNTKFNSWKGYMEIGVEYAVNRQGPAGACASQVCCFATTRKDSSDPERADFQFHFQPLSTTGSPAVFLDKFSAFTSSVTMLRPKSTGTLELTSANPLTKPKVNANYLDHELDRATFIESVRIARQVSLSDPLLSIGAREDTPGLEYETDEQILQWIRDNAETVYHPVGTAKMGHKDDPTSVVDEKLRVKGVKNLRVADASIMPIIISGNTNFPCMMIGDRCGEFILDEQE